MFRGRNPVGRYVCFWHAFLLCLGSVADLPAQTPDAKPKVGFGIATVGPGGSYAYVPKRWGVLHVNVINRQEKDPLEIFSATYFDQEPTLQYGRKIWVPPRSRMQSWHPVRIPEKADPDGKTVHFHSLVMHAGASQEVLIRTESGQMEHDGYLHVGTETNTGMIYQFDTGAGPETDLSVSLVSTCREGQNLNRKVSTVTNPIFVPGEESLQSLDQLVICDSHSARDAAALQAIRHWLHRGGKLWVMLDQVDPDLLNQLLGDEFQCQVVDRVSLTTVRIEAGTAAAKPLSVTEFDQPVDMVRVLTSDVDVAFSINGWPAAFWKTCGQGRLLVTTLGPRGWLKPRDKPAPPPPPNFGRGRGQPPPPSEPPPAPSPGSNKPVPNDAMSQLSSDFFVRAKPEAIPPAVLEPIVQEYVGYNIPSRWLIIGLLVGFSGTLAIAGIWLWRISRLEWLGAIGPVLATLVSLVLIGAGRQQRQAVPATTAGVQFIQAIQGTDDFLAEGQLGLFSQDSGQMALGSHRAGWLIPEMKGLEGTTRRMIWTDLDNWKWQNLPATAGLRTATFRKSGELTPRITATAMFGPEGLKGQLQTPGQHRATDALVATVGGRIGVEISADGTFSAPTTRVFSTEQFLGADLLSDEQNRRQKALQQLLTNRERIDYPAQPMLLFWTDSWDLGFDFPADARTLGSALVTIPLKLQRPPVGTNVSIAAPLLTYRATRGPDGVMPSGLWDPRKREWTEKSGPSATWFRFQLPTVLLPVQPLSGRVVVKVTGPVGKLEIAGVRQGNVEILKTWMDPVGTLEFPINEGDVLNVDAEGGVLLRIAGGDPDRPELTKTKSADGDKIHNWKFESLTLELMVKTVE